LLLKEKQVRVGKNKKGGAKGHQKKRVVKKKSRRVRRS